MPAISRASARHAARIAAPRFAVALLAAACSRDGASRDAPAASAAPSALAAAAPGVPAVSAAPAPATSGARGDAGGKLFGAACVDDAECAGGVCFHKRIKAPDAGRERRGARDPEEHDGYCSLRCDTDADCPMPLTRGKCGARGMCKRAE